MNASYYKYISWILAIVVIGLLVYIFTRPKPVNTLALSEDLAQFQVTLQDWNAQYGGNVSSTAAQAALSQDLSTFNQKFQQDE